MSNKSRESQKSIYRPKNPEKYVGKHTPYMRSNWERQFARWLDYNPNVEWWISEGTVVPYISKVDNRTHRYYIDFTVKFTNGKTVMFEVKPHKQTQPPEIPTRKTKRFLTEVQTYAVNVSKWEYAKEYAKRRGYSFQILTEHELKKMGIRIKV